MKKTESRNAILKTKVTSVLFVGMTTIFAMGAISCGQAEKTQSSIKVTNGVEIDASENPSVVLLYINNQGVCTGTFVNDYQVVTAAHCVDRVSSVVILDKVSGRFKQREKYVSYKKHPKYTSADQSKYDVAVVNFPKGTSDETSLLSPKSPSAGEKFSIVGYGNNVIEDELVGNQIQQSGSTVKRKGKNKIDSIEDGLILFEGDRKTFPTSTPGINSAAAGGDSGGPMFNNKGEIIGLTSHGKIFVEKSDKTKISKIITAYVDVNSEYVASFLEEELGL